MVILFSLLNLLFPPAQDCYLEPGVLDPHTSHDLKNISFEVSADTGISISESQQLLSCIPNSRYSQNRNQSETSHASPQVSPIKTESLYSKMNKSLVDPYRISQGSKFYQEHLAILQAVEKEFGVDPFVITAIIGAESNYGRFTGSHIIKSALATVIANTPPETPMPFYDKNNKKRRSRKQYFIDQLKSLVTISLNTGYDMHTLQGSWDGGIGLAQFMPESYQAYAVSPKNDYPDLFNPEDAIFSIANYLSVRGKWQPGPIATLVTPAQEVIDVMADKASIPFDTIVSRYTDTTKPSTAISNNHIPSELYQFTQSNSSSVYWLTYPNFDAIRSYNPRPHYAINIHILTEAIKDHVRNHSA